MLSYIYTSAFLFTVHYALLLYVSSTYISEFVPKGGIEAVYIAIALLSFAIMRISPFLLRKVGQYKTTVTFAAILIVCAVALSYSNTPAWVVPIFILLNAVQFPFRYDLDMYIEKYSRESTTGETRGIYLTVINTAVALSPLCAAALISRYGFHGLYAASALVMIPVLIIAKKKLSKVKDLRYHTAPFLPTLKKIYSNKNIFNITAVGFLLDFFYTWMVIYTPLYLTQTIGFDWDDIGIAFTIMLTAFLIVELPAGKIADKYLGEKEMMTAGFFIMSLSTALIPFMATRNIFYWAGLLFATRIGAALVESMTEAYFFKKIKPEDADIVCVFRTVRSSSYLFGIAAAGIMRMIFDGHYEPFFFVLAVIMLYGIRHSVAIQDTK